MAELLPHQEFLFTTAEVAATFVGFSLVVSLIRPQSATESVRVVSLRDVAEISLVGVAASLAPYVLFQFQVSLDGLWRIASLLLAMGWIAGFATGFRRLRGAGGVPPWRAAPAFARATALVGVSGNLLLWWNFFVPGPFSGARYLLSLSLLLTLAGFIFVFAAFHHPRPPAPSQGEPN